MSPIATETATSQRATSWLSQGVHSFPTQRKKTPLGELMGRRKQVSSPLLSCHKVDFVTLAVNHRAQRHPRNPRVITISETAGSSAELRLRRRAQGGCAVEGYTRATSNRATTTMRRASATTTMRLWHADRRSRGMCCQGRIEKRRTESRIERLQREEGSVVRPLRGPL